MEIVIFPTQKDNYSYILIDESKETVVVDPHDPERLSSELKKRNLKLKAILSTHHHHDHAGKNSEMLKLFPGIEIYGQAFSRIFGF